jgi:hypothetical protein
VENGPGGGIFIPGGGPAGATTVQIQDTHFVDCFSTSEGGGIYMREQTVFTLNRVTFSNCPTSITALNTISSSIPLMQLTMTDVQFCSGWFKRKVLL